MIEAISIEMDGTLLNRNQKVDTAAILKNKSFYFEIYTSERTYTKNYQETAAALAGISLSANPGADLFQLKERVLSGLKPAV